MYIKRIVKESRLAPGGGEDGVKEQFGLYIPAAIAAASEPWKSEATGGADKDRPSSGQEQKPGTGNPTGPPSSPITPSWTRGRGVRRLALKNCKDQRLAGSPP